MIKLSLYDFDKTIFSKDTGVEVIRKLARTYPLYALCAIPCFIYSLIRYIIKKDTTVQLKENMYFFMKYFTKSKWDLFITEFWNDNKKHFFTTIVQQLHKDKEDGYTVGIISASPETMLYPIMNLLPADFLIGTVNASDTEKMSSRIIGKNCKNQEKVSRLTQYMKDNFPKQDYQIIKMYSDSLNDLPLFEVAEKQYTVEADGSLREGIPKPNKNI